MKTKHMIFIVNEFSRNGKKTTHQLRQVMQDFDCTYEIHITQYPEHATLLAEQLAAKVDQEARLVAVGGDGTLNETVQGLLKVTPSLPLGYIPTGSGNDFARSLALPMKIEAAVKNIINTGTPTQLDVLVGKSDYSDIVAVNSIGFGLDGMVISKLDKNKNKQTIGKFSYLASVLSAYFNQKSFPIKLFTEKQTFTYGDALLIVCTNNKFFGGGIPIHPEADATDGLIDLVIAEKVTFLELLQILFSVLTTQNHLNHPKLHSHQVASCSFSLYTPQFGQRDGELIEKNIQNMSVKLIKRPFWI
ncbi:MAG: YegS/Rv2252/BmrU family lipid kinase [Alkalibacterium sp.]